MKPIENSKKEEELKTEMFDEINRRHRMPEAKPMRLRYKSKKEIKAKEAAYVIICGALVSLTLAVAYMTGVNRMSLPSEERTWGKAISMTVDQIFNNDSGPKR